MPTVHPLTVARVLASSPRPPVDDALRAGDVLPIGGHLRSQIGIRLCGLLVPRHVLYFQPDGDLVLYDSGNPVWSAGTARGGGNLLTVTSDGVLVMRDKGGASVWIAAQRCLKAGAMLVLQEDGVAVMTIPTEERPLWSTRGKRIASTATNMLARAHQSEREEVRHGEES